MAGGSWIHRIPDGSSKVNGRAFKISVNEDFDWPGWIIYLKW